MPRANSFVDDDFDSFPKHVQLQFGEDASWWAGAKCRTTAGVRPEAFTVRADETIVYADLSEMPGETLIEMALELCRVCPVQWDCSAYTVRTASYYTYIWGTWGCSETDMRWLVKRGKEEALGVIETARETGTPVQVAVRDFATQSGRRPRRRTAA